MTYSIGFRAPAKNELARELLQRLAEDVADAVGESRYRDPGQGAVSRPGAVPAELMGFARQALAMALKDASALLRVLGEYLTEPKSRVWFESGGRSSIQRGVVLDRRTRMMYDTHHVFINGESYRASGRDARLMQHLSDVRMLTPADMLGASEDARALLRSWCRDGWAHGR